MKVLFRAKTMRQDYNVETNGLKKINGIWYAIGNEQPCVEKEFEGIKLCAIVGEDLSPYLCRYDTRAIHFEDMLDSENNPIFASLQKDGKGGDRLFGELYKVPMVAIIENGSAIIKGRDSLNKILSIAMLRVVGVELPEDSIEKLIGRKLTWKDEPVELKEEQ